nr:unnamed protein product [Digitaria exilis]
MAAAAVLSLLLVSALAGAAAGGDIVHHDDEAPKIPGCNNDFILVKVQSWVNGKEGDEFVGVGARFGPKIVSKEKHANRTKLTLADPIECCSPPKDKVSGDILLVQRGKCKFTKKAKFAEAAELYKMVCEKNETDLDIHIPAVLLPKDAVSVQLYSPDRPVVDTAEGLQTCLVALLSRWFKPAAESFVKVPFIGAVSHLTLAVCPFCIAFAVLWAVFRQLPYAWIGQDILGIALIVTVIQIVRVPNLKVGSVLLSCAFLYDIFWVFVSKRWFHESVMIVVARGDKTDEDGVPIYDFVAKKSLQSGYFLWSMVAYGSGLLITYVALNLMDGHGQPALLYIVPFTLGTLIALGWKRGELQNLWMRGEPERVCTHMHIPLLPATPN